MRYSGLVVLLILLTYHSEAAARNCTADEKAAGNDHLTEIAGDRGTRLSILTKHLPFGAHRSTVAQNADLLYQGGYVLAHDPELSTATWVSYHLDGKDIAGAAGQDRVNCFRKDPRLGNDI